MRKYAVPIIIFVIGVASVGVLFLNTKNSSPNNTLQPTQAASETPNNQIANPASENCVNEGGTVSIKEGPNGQYGLCEFEDNMACEEWAMMRGECPVGGVKTTGYVTDEQKYCAWVGGETIAEENASCTLPDGSICKNSDLYDGTCAQASPGPN